MKSFIRSVNDGLVYLAFAILLIFVAITVMNGEVLLAAGVLVCGGIILCLLFGAWIAVSQIAEESEKQTKILENLLSKEV